MELEFGANSRFARFPYFKAKKLIEHALKLGVRRFDTGFTYGNSKSQPLLAKCLKDKIKKDREYISISTKCVPSSPEYIEDCILRSVDMFGCGYIDNFHLWGPNITTLENNSIMRKIKSLQDRGLIKLASANTHHMPTIKKISSGSYDEINGLLIDFNLLKQNRIKYIRRGKKNNLTIFAGTPLCQGLLLASTSKIFLRTWSPFYLGRAILNKDTRNYLHASRKLRKYLNSNYKDIKGKIPLSYVLNEPSIDYVPIGMMSISSIEKNIRVLKEPVEKKITEKVSEWSIQNCQI